MLRERDSGAGWVSGRRLFAAQASKRRSAPPHSKNRTQSILKHRSHAEAFPAAQVYFCTKVQCVRSRNTHTHMFTLEFAVHPFPSTSSLRITRAAACSTHSLRQEHAMLEPPAIMLITWLVLFTTPSNAAGPNVVATVLGEHMESREIAFVFFIGASYPLLFRVATYPHLKAARCSCSRMRYRGSVATATTTTTTL